MTRPFGTYYTCQHCGKPTTAETGFGRWMRACADLDSSNGIVRTDTDHTILRFKTHVQGRRFQLLMDVEVKEYGSLPREDQRDLIGFKHQLQSGNGRNLNGATTRLTRKLFSTLNKVRVNVRYLGYHLLRFEKTCPVDSEWMEWDHKRIDEGQLVKLLAIEVDPYNPARSMHELLRDRHVWSSRHCQKCGIIIPYDWKCFWCD
jgi:hypothetical protein